MAAALEEDFRFFKPARLNILRLLVGWVERQNDGGFRCVNQIMLISRDIQTTHN